jgi:hypothetical protein
VPSEDHKGSSHDQEDVQVDRPMLPGVTPLMAGK